MGASDAVVQAKEKRRPRGVIPARCNSSSRFSEKHGRFCYSACGSGFEPKSHTKCTSKCDGKFPAESLQMCAQDQSAATKAIIEMATTVLNAGFSLSEDIVKMKKHGVEATSLSSTIQVFIDMGKPFANPICPVTSAQPLPMTSPQQNNSVPKDAIADPSQTMPTCSMGHKVLISSHRGEQLQDKHGRVRFSKNKYSWEKWTLSDAGDGKVLITSHRGAQLADHQGNVVMSWGKRDWEKWQLTNAGNGRVYITSHQHQHLQDNADHAKLSANAGAWEAFMITDSSDANACTIAPNVR